MAPEYLEARIKEQEAERRLREFQTPHVAEMKPRRGSRLRLGANRRVSGLWAKLSEVLDALEEFVIRKTFRI
jgi:hypothetical protein